MIQQIESSDIHDMYRRMYRYQHAHIVVLAGVYYWITG